MFRLATIVEGHGEVEAVPILLRRIAEQVAPALSLRLPRPIRVNRQRVLTAGELERAVEFAARQGQTGGGVLVLLDANGDCPAELGPQLLRRATEARGDRAIRVVLAASEYEAWFLAAAGSIAGRHGVHPGTVRPKHPESIRDAKGWLSKQMPTGQRYRQTLHQPAFTAIFDLEAARTAPSFDKLWRDVSALLNA
ncbi:MAG: DUF4276 family protein [Acidobacteria bacterium]|nr:DUF4276 family protein [Acidobacteriota bacterium]MYD71160.1 DUF4276 family protein [Acidobacteriota bacterium]